MATYMSLTFLGASFCISGSVHFFPSENGKEDLCVLTGDKMSELTSLTSPELALNQWPPETIL